MNTSFCLKFNNLINQEDLKIIASRIFSCIGYGEYNTINEKETYAVYEVEDKIYLEVYKYIKQTDRRYMVNIIGIDDEQKRAIFKCLSGDNVFKEIIILFDYISNSKLINESSKFFMLENMIRLYFLLVIIEEYNSKAIDIVQNFNIKAGLREDASNIINVIQGVELKNLIGFMQEKPLAGLEYQQYYSAFKKDKLKEELDKDIFKSVKKIRNDVIGEYRNVICHNRIIDWNEYKQKCCDKVQGVKNELSPIISEILKQIFNKEIDCLNLEGEHLIFSIFPDKSLEPFEVKMLVNQLLIKLGIEYDRNNLRMEQESIWKYTDRENPNFKLYLNYIYQDEQKKSVLQFLLQYNENDERELVQPKEYLEKIIKDTFIREKVLILFDTYSMKLNSMLYKSYNLLENILRSYISAFYYFEGLDIGINTRRTLKNYLSIDGENKIGNDVYEIDFIELLEILISPNGGEKIEELKKDLKRSLHESDIQHIEVLLNNMIAINSEIRMLSNNADILYKYRTMVAHNYIITHREYLEVSKLLDECKRIIEDIFIKYLSERLSALTYKEETLESLKDIVEIEQLSELGISSKIKLLDKEEKLNEFKYTNISMLALYKLIMSATKDELTNDYYILSCEVIKELIEKNKEDIKKLLTSDRNIEKIMEYTNKLGYIELTDHRILSSQNQILQEKIGELLRRLDEKYKGNN